MSGAFITFEGGDGTGKSTQIKLLASRLKKLGYSVILSREPGGTPLGENLRKILKTQKMSPLAELFIFEASRAEHVEKLIKPALQKKQIVIVDRYSESSLVYQGVGRGLGLKKVSIANQMATQGLRPHLIIFLDSHKHHILQARRKSRSQKNDRFEKERATFHEKVEKAFRTLARKDSRFKAFEATDAIPALHDQILKVVLRKLAHLGVNRRRG